MKYLICIALALLTGCATQPKVLLTKEGVTTQSFTKDLLECEYEAKKHSQVHSPGTGYRSAVGPELESLLQSNQRFHELTLMCMKARGYTE
ncbi:hypothetical protein [Acidovorax sp.]|uniref:hypothetical protein n=1 Tax=Acidovorax sp. TaxID=1872122 RepID=UPI00391FBD59